MSSGRQFGLLLKISFWKHLEHLAFASYKSIWRCLYSSGVYSDWTDWSPCSISCAESTELPGVKKRNATCKQDCDDVEEVLTEETSCWGNPDPTFCSTGSYKIFELIKITVDSDCEVLSTRVKQTTQGHTFEIDLSLKKPEESFSKVMMVSCTHLISTVAGMIHQQSRECFFGVSAFCFPYISGSFKNYLYIIVNGYFPGCQYN